MRSAASFIHPRDEILQAIQRIYRYRMTTTSGGNLSIREENGDIWITPARLDKGSLRREDIVCVHGDGTVVGPHRPSSELPFHQEIYRTRQDIHGIVHAHPVALVAFSLVHRIPDTRLFHQTRQVCGEAGFAAYELPGSLALGQNVAAIFGQGFNCVLLENHGAVTGGANLQEAFHRFETLEFTAKTIIKARMLGEVRYLTDAEIAIARDAEPEWTAVPHHEPTTHEKELRARLAEFVRRAYRQRLFISTQGSFSARVDTESFLITPYRQDRGTIDVHDLVLVRNGECESGAVPSRAALIHEEIYRQHAGIGAIVNAYPVNASAFSVTGVPLDSRTIPESYIVIREVSRFPYGLQFSDTEELATLMSSRRPAALLENDGVLVTGSDILEAFDRLEVLESTAEAIINCHTVGTLAPMPEAVTRELDRVFLGGVEEMPANKSAKKDDSPESRLEGFLDKFTPEVAAVARACLTKMRARLPGAVQLVYDNYNALAIGFGPSERASEAIFSIVLYPRWVTLFFLQGAGLADPKRLLKGSGKVVRHVVLASAADLDLPDIKDLMTKALRRAEAGIDPTSPGRLVIRSVCAKQRPRRPA